MPLALDHVFICCRPGAPEAEALAAIGLVEGSGNVHPGQGTANRRFFFEGGFIELLWVADAAEAQSPLTAPTRLWPRWAGRDAGACPFGVAFSPSGAEVPAPPFPAWRYRPVYLPADKAIWFAEGTPLAEPELFYLAWAHTHASAASQPKAHTAPLVRLVSASVGLPGDAPLSEAAHAVEAAGLLGFHTSDTFELVLRFEAPHDVAFDLRPTLGLRLQGFAKNQNS